MKTMRDPQGLPLLVRNLRCVMETFPAVIQNSMMTTVMTAVRRSVKVKKRAQSTTPLMTISHALIMALNALIADCRSQYNNL